MFTVEEIMNYFVSQNVIDSMGNWWPRVLAVMSCVSPAMYIAFTFVTVCVILACVWKVVVK